MIDTKTKIIIEFQSWRQFDGWTDKGPIIWFSYSIYVTARDDDRILSNKYYNCNKQIRVGDTRMVYSRNGMIEL
jgi:hypothetical protein